MVNEPAPQAVSVAVATLQHQADVSALRQLVADGVVRPHEIRAITGKTEGNVEGENSRGILLEALREFFIGECRLTDRQLDDMPIVLSSGGVGILAPHLMVYTRSDWAGPLDDEPRLTIGTAMSEPIRPEWVGRTPMVAAVAEAIRAAAGDARIDPGDAEYVLLKTRGIQPGDVDEAKRRGVDLQLWDRSIATPKTNGAAGLAVAVAVDGLPLPTDDQIAVELNLWSGKASASVGREDPRTNVVLLGNSSRAGGHLRIGQAVMKDLLDIQALFRALRSAGLDADRLPLNERLRRRVVAVYVKISTPPDARIRGRRQVHQGENPSYVKELKAAVAGMFSAALQDTILYISSSGAHQGPPGGATVAVIVDHSPLAEISPR